LVVQGGAVGSWTRSVKIPEEWRRAREETTAWTEILRFLKVPFLGLFAGLAIVVFIVKVRRGEVPWKFALLVGAIAVLPAVTRSLVFLGRFWADRYETSIPEVGFAITLGV